MASEGDAGRHWIHLLGRMLDAAREVDGSASDGRYEWTVAWLLVTSPPPRRSEEPVEVAPGAAGGTGSGGRSQLSIGIFVGALDSYYFNKAELNVP